MGTGDLSGFDHTGVRRDASNGGHGGVVDGGGVHGRTTQGVGHDIGGASHVAEIGRKLGDEAEVARLTRGFLSRAGQGATQRLVIRPHHKRPAF